MERQDRGLLFYWGDGSPDPSVPADNFSARWTGELWLPAGSYTYILAVDDGARFWIDEQLVIDAWVSTQGEMRYGVIYLGEGFHAFRVEYYEATLDALIRLVGKPGEP